MKERVLSSNEILCELAGKSFRGLEIVPRGDLVQASDIHAPSLKKLLTHLKERNAKWRDLFWNYGAVDREEKAHIVFIIERGVPESRLLWIMGADSLPKTKAEAYHSLQIEKQNKIAKESIISLLAEEQEDGQLKIEPRPLEEEALGNISSIVSRAYELLFYLRRVIRYSGFIDNYSSSEYLVGLIHEMFISDILRDEDLYEFNDNDEVIDYYELEYRDTIYYDMESKIRCFIVPKAKFDIVY